MLIIFLYIIFVICILLGLGSLAGAIYTQDLVILLIGVLLLAASILVFLELRKMQQNPFE